MNYQEFCTLERVGQRAITAAKAFAGGVDAEVLSQLSTVLAELRHASDWLCDPAASFEDKKLAGDRLFELFTVNPK